MSRRWVLSFLVILTPYAAKAAVNELPVPYNLQTVILKRNVSLNWRWDLPQERPAYADFGYEIQRDGKPLTVVPETTYTDTELAFGTHTYTVRARATVKKKGKKILYISDWSEPAQIVIQVACRQAPQVSLAVEASKKVYEAIPSLRMRLSGDTSVPEGCTLTQITYHIGSDTGLSRSGILTLNAKGHFDENINALGPDDEYPTRQASFTVTVTAEDEAGPVTSNAYTLDISPRDPYAPHANGE